MSKKFYALVALAFFLISGFFPSAASALVSRLTFKETCDQSTIVVTGTVDSVKSSWNTEKFLLWDPGNIILTYAEIDIQDSLKGDELYQKVTVVTLGGKVGNEEVWVEDEPSFRVGERVVLFLKQQAKNLWRPVGKFQGKFSMENGQVFRDGAPALPLDFFWEQLNRETFPEDFAEALPALATPCKPRLKCETFKRPWKSDAHLFYLQKDTKDFLYRYVPLQFGAVQWDGVPYQLFRFLGVQYQGTPVTKPARDGVNLILWAPISEKTTVAMTTCRYTDNLIVEADIIFNSNLPWSGLLTTPGGYDIQAVATHEFGHVAGLQDLYSQECQEQTMFWSVAPVETKKRDLAAADILGLQWLYPKLKLSFDIAGVDTTAYVDINNVRLTILCTHGAGYYQKIIQPNDSINPLVFNMMKSCSPDYLIFSPGIYSGNDLDEIQITNIKLQHLNGRVILEDHKVYHIGDNTPAQIAALYKAHKWYDPNPPAFWKNLWGQTLKLPLDYPPKGEFSN